MINILPEYNIQDTEIPLIFFYFSNMIKFVAAKILEVPNINSGSMNDKNAALKLPHTLYNYLLPWEILL